MSFAGGCAFGGVWDRLRLMEQGQLLTIDCHLEGCRWSSLLGIDGLPGTAGGGCV